MSSPARVTAKHTGTRRTTRGYGRCRAIRTIVFLIASKLDFSSLDPCVAQPA